MGLLVARFGAFPESHLSCGDLVALGVATLERDPRHDVKRAAGALLGALYTRLVDDAAVDRVSRSRDFSLKESARDARLALLGALEALGASAPLLDPPASGDATRDVALALDPTRRHNDPSLDAWILAPLRRVDLEMERRYGSAPSVAAEAKQLKKAAAQAAAARKSAANVAISAARAAYHTADAAATAALQAARLARARDANDIRRRLDGIAHIVYGRRLARNWRKAFRQRLYRARTDAADAAADVALKAQTAASHAAKPLPDVLANIKDKAVAFHAMMLDLEAAAAAADEARARQQEVEDVEAAMLGDADAPDTARSNRSDSKPPSEVNPTPKVTPRPDGKVHPLPDGPPAHSQEGAPDRAAGGPKKKEGCLLM